MSSIRVSVLAIGLIIFVVVGAGQFSDASNDNNGAPSLSERSSHPLVRNAVWQFSFTNMSMPTAVFDHKFKTSMFQYFTYWVPSFTNFIIRQYKDTPLSAYVEITNLQYTAAFITYYYWGYYGALNRTMQKQGLTLTAINYTGPLFPPAAAATNGKKKNQLSDANINSDNNGAPPLPLSNKFSHPLVHPHIGMKGGPRPEWFLICVDEKTTLYSQALFVRLFKELLSWSWPASEVALEPTVFYPWGGGQGQCVEWYFGDARYAEEGASLKNYFDTQGSQGLTKFFWNQANVNITWATPSGAQPTWFPTATSNNPNGGPTVPPLTSTVAPPTTSPGNWLWQFMYTKMSWPTAVFDHKFKTAMLQYFTKWDPSSTSFNIQLYKYSQWSAYVEITNLQENADFIRFYRMGKFDGLKMSMQQQGLNFTTVAYSGTTFPPADDEKNKQ